MNTDTCWQNLMEAEQISMPRQEFMAEHKRLIRVLTKPTRKNTQAELARQKRELKEYV